MIKQLLIVFTLLILSGPVSLVWADSSQAVEPVSYEGVFIDALETYTLPRSSQVTIGVGFWPTDAYYNAFGINLSYIHNFNKSWSWEVLRGTYLITTDKALTSQLAEDFSVSPERIDRLNYAGGSHLIYHPAYGKFTFGKEHIRYFRFGFSFGGALLGEENSTEVVPVLGARAEIYRDPTFTWIVEIRDHLSFKDEFENILSVEFGTGISF